MSRQQRLTAQQAVQVVYLSLLEVEDVTISLEVGIPLPLVRVVQYQMKGVEVNRETGYGCPKFETCPQADDCLGPDDRPCSVSSSLC